MVLKFIEYSAAFSYQIINKRFYNLIMPRYINMAKISRIDRFFRFVYTKKKVQIFDLYRLDWTSKTISKHNGAHLLIDNC